MPVDTMTSYFVVLQSINLMVGLHSQRADARDARLVHTSSSSDSFICAAMEIDGERSMRMKMTRRTRTRRRRTFKKRAAAGSAAGSKISTRSTRRDAAYLRSSAALSTAYSRRIWSTLVALSSGSRRMCLVVDSSSESEPEVSSERSE
jgi:hypothetical protein